MKKELIRISIGLFVLAALGAGALSFIDKDVRDRFNPFLEKEDVYVFINQAGKEDPDFKHRYMFIVDGVDDSGEAREIKITTSVKDFPEDTLLKVHVKGSYVYSYENVTEENIPENALKELSWGMK